MTLKYRLDVRVDEKTKKIIEDNAKAQGLGVSAYVRMLLLRSLEGVK